MISSSSFDDRKKATKTRSAEKAAKNNLYADAIN
jgi:hypothetical protein